MMLTPFVRNPYNYDVDLASDEAGLHCADESLAVQDARDETDINNILRQFGITGQLPQNVRAPTYGDFTDAPDNYHGALNAVLLADEAFMRMPADVRARFDNDAGRFVDFCSDSNNLEELRKLGLAKPAPLDVAVDGRVIPPSGGSAEGGGAAPKPA
ncbi:MAG: internal scaffolding protein [Microviridae sp.]|nr:MAG: internal scaffolding protein [Microviridae sp.]